MIYSNDWILTLTVILAVVGTMLILLNRVLVAIYICYVSCSIPASVLDTTVCDKHRQWFEADLDPPQDTYWYCNPRVLGVLWLFLQANLLGKSCRCLVPLNNSYSGITISISILGRIQDFKLGGGALKKIAPSGGRRENIWGISCEFFF
jgi:hypothetical protein